MYRQSKGVGAIAYPASTMASTKMYQGPRKQFLCVAGGAIPAGQSVVPGDDGAGRTVIAAVTATANHSSSVCGLYEGEGGTGAESAMLGFTAQGAKAAVLNDFIWLTIHGVAKAIVNGTTLASGVPRAPLFLKAATNDLTDIAAIATPGQASFVLLETMTQQGVQSGKNVWVRLG